MSYQSPTDYHRIPPHMMEGLIAYRDSHIPVGGFLQAIIGNNLTEAVARADDTNLWIIPIYVSWFRWEMPADAWGNSKAYIAWIQRPLDENL